MILIGEGSLINFNFITFFSYNFIYEDVYEKRDLVGALYHGLLGSD